MDRVESVLIPDSCSSTLYSYTALYTIQPLQHPSDTCYLPPLQSVVCGELQDWISYLYLCKGYCLCATHVIQVSILQIPDSFANQQLSFTGGINCTGTNRVEPTQGKREEPSSPLARRGPTLIEGTSRKCPHAEAEPHAHAHITYNAAEQRRPIPG